MNESRVREFDESVDSVDPSYWEPQGQRIPLVFRHESIVGARSLKVRITMRGRFLATVRDNGTCCIDGVNPGAISVQGLTLDDAEHSFRYEMDQILHDIVSSCNDTTELEAELDDFMKTTDNDTVRKWLEARRKPVASRQLSYVSEACGSGPVRWRNAASVRKVHDSTYSVARAAYR